MTDHDKFIGGSDIAKILGEHAFEGPKSVYQRLRDGVDTASEDLSDNRDIMRGVACEPKALDRIREQYPSLNSEKVRSVFDAGGGRDGQIRLQHPNKPYLAGSVDGMSIDPFGGSAVVHEVKSPRSSGIKRIEKRGIPSRYFWQVQFYAGIANEIYDGTVESYVWLWNCDKWDVERIEVEWQPERFERIVDVCDRFYAFASEDIPFEETDLGDQNEEVDRDVYSSEEMSAKLSAYHNIHQNYKRLSELKADLKREILSQLDGEEKIDGRDHYAKIQRRSNATYLTVRERE